MIGVYVGIAPKKGNRVGQYVLYFYKAKYAKRVLNEC